MADSAFSNNQESKLPIDSVRNISEQDDRSQPGFVALTTSLKETQNSAVPDQAATTLFRDSFEFEINRSIRGVAQLVGAEQSVQVIGEPTEAQDTVGQHAQMLGRAVGGLLPTLGLAVASRFGIGKLFSSEMKAAEHATLMGGSSGSLAERAETALLKRTAFGLNSIEAATTGFLSGSLLTPTDTTDGNNGMGMIGERIKTGTISALSFGVMAASSHGWNKLASSESAIASGAGRMMKSTGVNGLVSGIPGGIANVEIDSLVRDGKLNLDKQQVGKSIYEMSLFGGIFEAGSKGIAMSGARKSNNFLDHEYSWNSDNHLVTPEGLGLGGYKLFNSGNALKISTSSEPSTKIIKQRESLATEASKDSNHSPNSVEALNELSSRFVDQPDAKSKILKVAEQGHTSLESFATFIEQNPETNKKLVLELIEAGATGRDLVPDRIKGVQEIYAQFGKDSDTTKRIFELENKGVQIADLGEFVGNKSEHTALLSQLVDAANLSNLTNYRLHSITRLTDLMPESSTTLARFVKLESEGRVSFPDVVRFLQGVSGESHTQSTITDRIQWLGKMTAGETGPSKLGSDRLNALYRLGSLFGEDSDTVSNLLKLESENNVSLAKLSDYAKSGDTEFLKRVVDSGITKAKQDMIPTLKKIDESVHLDSDALRHLISLPDESSLISIRTALELNEAQSKPIVEQLIAERSSVWGFRPQELTALTRLKSLLGPDVPIQSLTQLSGKMELTQLVKLIEKSPEQLKSLVKEGLQHANAPKLLNTERLSAVMDVQSEYAAEPNVFEKLLELERHGLDLIPLNQFIRNQSLGPRNLVKRMVDEGASEEKFQLPYLKARDVLDNLLGPNSPRTEAILDAGQLNGTTAALGDFVRLLGMGREVEHANDRKRTSQENSLKGQSGYSKSFEDAALKGVDLIERRIQAGDRPDQLTVNRLTAMHQLETKYGTDTPVMQRLHNLEADGFSWVEASQFIQINHKDFTPLFQKIVEDGASAKLLTKNRLLDRVEMGRLSEFVAPDSDVMKHLWLLNQDGLSGSRTFQYLDEKVADRLPVIEKLANEKAPESKFRDLMLLQALPANVAESLVSAAERGEMPVARIVSRLKDWKSGAHFRDLLIKHVEALGDLSVAQMERLVQHAQEDASRSTPSRAVDSIAVMPPLHVPSDLRVSTEVLSMADILKTSTDGINAKIPADKNIVLLGRDMWSLYPLLKSQGRSVQYFIWSSIQDEKSTARQWLKEVPPNSMALDSGYAGTILQKINKADATAGGMLLSTNSPFYAQILETGDPFTMVEQIERSVKPTGRTVRMTEDGNAVARPNKSSDVARKRLDDPRLTDRWRFERNTRDLYRTLGLPEWDAWRFSQFAGLTPRERLLLNTDIEVQDHYRRIEQMRNGSDVRS